MIVSTLVLVSQSSTGRGDLLGLLVAGRGKLKVSWLSWGVLWSSRKKRRDKECSSEVVHHEIYHRSRTIRAGATPRRESRKTNKRPYRSLMSIHLSCGNADCKMLGRRKYVNINKYINRKDRHPVGDAHAYYNCSFHPYLASVEISSIETMFVTMIPEDAVSLQRTQQCVQL